MDSDTDLLRRFASTGEEAAFSLLVARHAGMMQGVAVRCTGDHALAEEVTQTVFSILVRKARTLQHECVAGWLHRTTFLEARNALRKDSRYRRALMLFARAPQVASVTTPGAGEEILPHLDEVLARLPARDRELLILRFYEKKSVGEIADATGTNQEACKKRIQRSDLRHPLPGGGRAKCFRRFRACGDIFRRIVGNNSVRFLVRPPSYEYQCHPQDLGGRSRPRSHSRHRDVAE
jgi:RNA polymerase sigma factor (sigma-70 family)